MNDDLRARLAFRALALSLRLRPSHLASLTGHARQSFPTGAIDDAALDTWLLRQRKELESHFVIDARVPPEVKLERANARIAEQRVKAGQTAQAARPSVKLSDRELALPASIRLAIFEEKMAAAIAAQTKKEPKDSA